MAMAEGRNVLEGRRHLAYHADDSVAAGRVLIVSRWPYDERKRHISRSECVAPNGMAEEICKHLNDTGT